jgi:predicted metalloprotease with PDZ domain
MLDVSLQLRSDRPSPRARRYLLGLLCFLFAGPPPVLAADVYFDAAFRAELAPKRPVIRVELTLSGDRLPSRIEFQIDPERHRAFASKDPLSRTADRVTWQPQGKQARLTYEFVATHERAPKRYDSLVTDQWAIFRADRMVPRISVTSRRSLKGRTTLAFDLPKGWSIVTAYPREQNVFKIPDSDRRIDRPEGWVLAGRLGERSQLISGTQTIVAAPEGERARRQDILAFLNWNLPHLKDVFPRFPRRLLVVTAGDPMWRGGLSGPASLFLHADRPLISENRTSTLLHELVHVAMGIRGDEESDWIAEGFAEYYSLEILRRSGGIGRNRYEAAIARLAKWARESPSVFGRQSTGATTARAVIALREVDAEIRNVTGGRASLDDLAAALAQERGEVGLEQLQSHARKIAGRDLDSLRRERLSSLPAD